ncbi:hypothetical protein FRC00_009996 [Tulasnella sp. 408]|nr:hypothetical protein FRC00_009996 [Tulasnella sp. 408]
MTSGVDELEVFIAALRLSFLTSSTVGGSPEGLRQGIAAFRQALGPRDPLVASVATPDAYGRKADDINNTGLDTFAQAGEPISSSSTEWSGDDRIDVVTTKQIELVQNEVRESTSQVRELVQIVKELKAEVRDLRSALEASKSVASSEDTTPSSAPGKTEVRPWANSTPVYEPGVDAFPERSPGVVPSAAVLSAVPLPQSLPVLTPSDSDSIPTSKSSPLTALKSSAATELPSPPSAPSQSLPPAPCPVEPSAAAQTSTTAPADPVSSSGRIAPVAIDATRNLAFLFFWGAWSERVKAENPEASSRLSSRPTTSQHSFGGASTDTSHHPGEIGKLLEAKFNGLDEEEKSIYFERSAKTQADWQRQRDRIPAVSIQVTRK